MSINTATTAELNGYAAKPEYTSFDLKTRQSVRAAAATVAPGDGNFHKNKTLMMSSIIPQALIIEANH